MSSEPATRRELLAAGALVCAAGLTLPGSAVAATTTSATASSPPVSNGDRLRRMLSVELLLLYCYEHVLAEATRLKFTGHPRRVLTTLLHHEHAHVQALTTLVQRYGDVAPEPPSDDTVADADLARRGVASRIGQLQGRGDALHLLLDLEQVVTGVYFVALLKLEDRALIQTTLEIMAAEAQHEALLGELLNHGNIQMAVPYGLIQGIQ